MFDLKTIEVIKKIYYDYPNRLKDVLTSLSERQQVSKEWLVEKLNEYKHPYRNKLKGGDLTDTLSELRKQGIVPEGPELASYALRNDIDIPKGHVLNTKDVNNFLKDNPTLTVVDFLNDQNLKLQQAGKGNLNPGNYVVGKNILTVGEDGTVTDVLI